MSATTRQSIADALSVLENVNGYPKKPDVVTIGDAWPLVDSLERGPGQAFQTRWRIALVLGADVETATDQLDELVPAVCEALVAEVYVDSARPLSIPVEAGSLYGCEIIARSE